MGRPSKRVQEFMKTWGVDADEVWEVRSGGSWAIKHSAVERIAAQAGIVFDRPAIIESSSKDGTVCVCVFGRLGERSEWSFGEASPKNCKIAYPYSIAEKRGKDRVALKLLNASHGEIYSEDELDEEAPAPKRQNPHVNRAEELHELPAPGDGIEPEPTDIVKTRVVDQRPIFADLQSKIRNTSTLDELEAVKAEIKPQTGKLSEEWRKHLNGVYQEQKAQLLELERKLMAAE